MSKVEKIGIALFGYTGMVGQELERILEHHDHVEIVFRQNSKEKIGDLSKAQLAFLATDDGESMKLAPELLAMGIRVIDMSGAFRIPLEDFEKWYKKTHISPELIKIAAYGMPAFGEDYRQKIATAQLVANPGCYTTAVILALRPLDNFLKPVAAINATSGQSGDRKVVEPESNEVTYNFGTRHKHVPEMSYYAGFEIINFTPTVLRSVFRGINANIRVELPDLLANLPPQEAVEILTKKIRSTYVDEDLVFVVADSKEKSWGTKDVNGTHKVLIKINVDAGFAYITVMIDNLGKGAASQAVENMNIILGLRRLYGIDRTYKIE